MLTTKRDWGRTAKEPDSQGRFQCSRCREWKFPKEFNKNRKQKSGLNYSCRPCSTLRIREYNLPVKYGITAGKFAEMILAQGSKCACCAKPFQMEGSRMDRPAVDHNHNTGEVRSLLCGRCNLAAGNLLDSSRQAELMAAYLKKWNC